MNVKYIEKQCRNIFVEKDIEIKFIRTNVICPSIIQFLGHSLVFFSSSGGFHFACSFLPSLSKKERKWVCVPVPFGTQTHFCSFLLSFVPIFCVSVSIETFQDYHKRCDISRRRVWTTIEIDLVTVRRERFMIFFYYGVLLSKPCIIVTRNCNWKTIGWHEEMPRDIGMCGNSRHPISNSYSFVRSFIRLGI